MITILDVVEPTPNSGNQQGSTLSPLSSNWPYLVTILLLVMVIALLTYFLIKAKKKKS